MLVLCEELRNLFCFTILKIKFALNSKKTRFFGKKDKKQLFLKKERYKQVYRFQKGINHFLFLF
jgi:hypothetical protein